MPPVVVACLVAVMVAGGAIGGMLVLDARAERAHVIETGVAQLRVRANRVSSLEWQTVATGKVQVGAGQELVEMRDALEKLGEPRQDRELTGVREVFARYASAVRREFALLARGDAEAAERVDEEQVDPAFEDLHAQLRTAGAHSGERARRSARTGRWGTAGVIIFAVLLLVALIGRSERARRAAAHAEMAREETFRRYEALLRNSADVVLIVDDEGAVVYVSDPVQALLGRPSSSLLGRPLAAVVDDEGSRDGLGAAIAAATCDGHSAPAELRLTRADGKVVDVEARIADLRDNAEIGGLVLNIREITERKALELELRHQAHHDALTGLPNRLLLEDRLGRALARSRRHPGRVGMLLVDLDEFKAVNDSLGHAAGDTLLSVVAQRLQAAVRDSDTVARLSGDEFAILLDDPGDLEDVTELAHRLLRALEPPVQLHGRLVYAHASLGIALTDPVEHAPTDDQARAMELLRGADIAMYAAKTQGKNRVEVFAAHMHATAIERLERKAELQRALDRGELRLHFQPIVDLNSRVIVGTEALARWQHPARGLLGPGEFIQLAEETNLIVPLGAWVLREACRQAARWREQFPDQPERYVSVNVNGAQLQRAEFMDEVTQTLAASGLPANCLMLEVTESALLEDSTTNARRLQALRDLGVRLAIDDFGTGYSAINYLRRYRMDVLKIDRSFIDGVDIPSEQSALVDAILAMARALNLQVIAEGIELDPQLNHLRHHDCPLGQGFLFARPLAPDDLTALLTRHPHALPTPTR